MHHRGGGDYPSISGQGVKLLRLDMFGKMLFVEDMDEDSREYYKYREEPDSGTGG